MGYTLPVRDLSIDERKESRNGVQETMIAYALKRAIVMNRTEVSFRELDPEILELPTWSTPGQIISEWTPWINATIPVRAVIGIYKVLSLTENPTVSALRFRRPSQTVGIQELDSCYAGLPIIRNLSRALLSPTARQVLDKLAGAEPETSPAFGTPMEGYFSEAYVFGPTERFGVDVKVRGSDNSPDYLVLGGFILEPLGMTIA